MTLTLPLSNRHSSRALAVASEVIDPVIVGCVQAAPPANPLELAVAVAEVTSTLRPLRYATHRSCICRPTNVPGRRTVPSKRWRTRISPPARAPPSEWVKVLLAAPAPPMSAQIEEPLVPLAGPVTALARECLRPLARAVEFNVDVVARDRDVVRCRAVLTGLDQDRPLGAGVVNRVAGDKRRSSCRRRHC